MSQSRPRTLIIGLGSIGQRHADLLADLGAEVAACTRRREDRKSTRLNSSH